ncbi:hypothetical protein AK812_SmicGene35063 [Symbiodinium microadriaticum]|uniref:Uncharacterized protein n=1 Tax=Symbiodinium microadriaticum TaxID=2951 RepID=A0A1Q9CMJ4_SYMMI|nr:hypothetical protein AK812_SmicGene35063 [Symbiodinium microadriaticum]
MYSISASLMISSWFHYQRTKQSAGVGSMTGTALIAEGVIATAVASTNRSPSSAYLPQGGGDGAVQAGSAAAGGRLASVPARIGEDLMQIGHGSFAQLGCGGQLEECGGVGALGRNGEQSRPAGDPGRDGGRSQVGRNGVCAMAGEEAQELHCFGAEPAAGLDADNN